MPLWWAEEALYPEYTKPNRVLGCTDFTKTPKFWGDMESYSGSDFGPRYFSPEENIHWVNLLTQLRTFEATVCHTVRKLEEKVNKLGTIASPTTGGNWNVIAYEEKLDTLKDMLRQLDKDMGERILAVETDLDISHVKQADKHRDMEERILAVETDLDLAQAKITDMQIEKSKMVRANTEVLSDLREKIGLFEKGLDMAIVRIANMSEAVMGLEESVDKLEKHLDVRPGSGSEFKWNGHENTDGEGNEFMVNPEGLEEENTCDVMMGDPFLNSGNQISPYDGNPTLSFSRWAQKFKDLLNLYTTRLTEEQKINRLRFCLSGPARAELDGVQPQPDTLDGAIAHLQTRFENDNTKSIARQNLTICKQYPGERVFEFATRLGDAVRTALAGETETIIRKRLLEEFLDRLVPELQYEVKSERPNEYSRAFELAQHYELLQMSRKSAGISVGEVAGKLEAMTVSARKSREEPERRVCYYCKKAGHLIRDCRKRKRNQDEYGTSDRERYYSSSQNVYRYPSRERYRNPSRDRGRYGHLSDWSRERGQNNYNNREYYRRGERIDNYSSERGERRKEYSREREYRNRSGEQDEREYRSHRPPTPKVSFAEGKVASVRASSPHLLAMITILALFCPTFGMNTKITPMICLPDAPSSLWKLPEEPICPHWKPSESPIPMELSIHRANTLQYKTVATGCKCIKTIIHRRRGLLGQKLEEIETKQVEVPTSTCHRMRDMNHSPAGELNKNGTFKYTNNSLDVGWTIWPIGVFWQTTEVLNCYSYETVVFTRYGVEGISTPLGACPGCMYKSGACRCEHASLLWRPDPTQQCAYIWVAKWTGEYSTNVWLSSMNDFALTFENVTVRKDCENKEFLISDQGFSIPLEEYSEMIRRKELEKRENKRLKRQLEQITNDTTKAQGNSLVGLVYSSQLSAQLTALSAKLSLTTHRLFSEAIRQICTSLQSIADQTTTLAIANPILLARYFLGNQLITARLVTEKALEIKPCFAVSEYEMHYNWKKGFCFNRLPITFVLYGTQKHGFLDTNTLIIYPEAKEIDCRSGRWLYLQGEKKLTQYDQITGDIKEIPSEATHTIARHGNIDFPEMGFTIFKNKVMANLSELYSPEHFSETLEAAEIYQEIARLTKPNGAWNPNPNKPDFLAGNIVSNGLFSFLKGGVPSANQIWVFCVCCYVTVGAATNFFLPPFLANLAQYLNVGGNIIKVTRKFMKFHKNRKERRAALALERAQTPAVNQGSAIPLTRRWPSGELAPDNRMYPAVNEETVVALASTYICDENARIWGKINGQEVRILIDTGAHISICGIETAAKLSITNVYNPEVSGVIGISGGMVPIVSQTDVELVIADTKIKTPLVLIDNSVSKHGQFDVILGRKTLRNLPYLLDLETCSLIPKQKFQECKLAGNPETSRPISGTKKLLLGSTKVNTELQGMNLIKLMECLEQNHDVFSEHEYDLGVCTITAPPIITTTTVPVQNRPYRVPEKYQTELNEHLEAMIKVGVMEKSNTPWVSPIVIVQKGDGSLRPCIDFRALNKVTITDPFPIPRMETVLHKVAGRKFYTTLDLASGFWQIPLDPDTAYKCGVVTEQGVFMMKKLPFGLKNSPSIFQRIMDEILSEIDSVCAYIDDIIIYTDSLEEHLEILKKVCERMREYNLKFKPKKCEFCKSETVYLGHKLSQHGYEPSLNNKETIENFPAPKTVKETKRFLGLVGFFRKFIPNFAEKASPLTLLLRGKEAEKNFKWGNEQEKAFEMLKKSLANTPCLRSPNYDIAFHLFSDASQIAWAAALMQADEKGNLYAVAYCSKTLSHTESQYAASHGELAAIVHALTVFRPIIYGSELIIYTDHKPLTYLMTKGQTNPKINRWLLVFQDLNPSIQYIEGPKNVIADALSRVPIKNGIRWDKLMEKFAQETPYVLFGEKIAIDKNIIENETKRDNVLGKVINEIKQNWLEPTEITNVFYKIRDELYLEGNLIKKHPGQVIIPEKLRMLVLSLLHKPHFGITRTKGRARRMIWWPGMNKDIEEYISACTICQRNAPLPPKLNINHKWPESKSAMERVHIDLAGPIWNFNFLVAVDTHTKYPWIFALKTTTALSITNSLTKIFTEFGAPITVVSDNGTQFVAEETEIFFRKWGIKHLKSPPYTPSSNGAAEKLVQSFKRNVQKLMDDGESVKNALQIFLSEYRSYPCPSTQDSPAYRMFKREIRTPLDCIMMRWEDKTRPQGKEPKPFTTYVLNQYKENDPVWVNVNKVWYPAVIRKMAGERICEVMVDGEDKERMVHMDHIKGRKIMTRRQKV